MIPFVTAGPLPKSVGMCVGQGWPAAGYGAKTIAEVINNPSHVNSIPVSTEAIGDRLAVRISGTESLTADVVSLVADATGIGGGPGSTIAIGWPQLPHLMRFPTYLLSVRYRFWHWLQTTSDAPCVSPHHNRFTDPGPANTAHYRASLTALIG